MAKCVSGHSAFIYDRGGMRRIGPLVELSSVQWERKRDAVSEASVVIEGSACSDQAPFLSQIRAHRHELVIYRGTQRVWEGPIHRVTSRTNRVEVVAHDVLEYLMFTPLTREWSSAYPTVQTTTARIQGIIEYEMTHGRTQYDNGVMRNVPAWEAMSPPANVLPYLEVHNFPNEAKTTSVTGEYEMTVGEHLQSLGRQGGIDYTAVGRAIHIWDNSRALGRTVQLTERNFLTGIIVSEYGADHAQSAYVSTGDGAYGSALRSDNLDYYGPWTKVFTSYNEEGTQAPTQGELNSQAIRNLAGRTPAPVEVRIPDNSGLILSDEITIEHLIPGVQVPLRATLNARQHSQMQKIDYVRITEEAETGEQINITLVPTSKSDADEELPDPETHVSALFSRNSSYRLTAIASRRGNTVYLRARVDRLDGNGHAGGPFDWKFTLQRTAETTVEATGAWEYDFHYYTRKTAGQAQFENIATGRRTFSVTVDMGGSIGSAKISGTVDV